MTVYDKDYYENGTTLGISGYKDYRWLPDLTIPMCKSIVDGLQIRSEDVVLDYGCAKGYIVKALKHLGVATCHGVDISEYAIQNCDDDVRGNLFLLREGQDLSDVLPEKKYDWVICKDVLEHLRPVDVRKTLRQFKNVSTNIFVVVPLGDGKKYVIEDYEKDVTHIIREDMTWWKNEVQAAGFRTSSVYSFPGVKDNWSQYPTGNAFIIGRRVVD